MLKGKHILLGVTGSIAAYKAALLVRALVKQGAEVRVIMTEMAKQFITPLTMATLSKNPILVEFYNPENGDWNSHISLGMWADAYLIAPASANTIAKMATGVADNLLLTTYLSARCPVIVAPAMDVDMYLHTATQKNIETLALRGVKIIDPNAGELASGLEGKGRMAEPEEIAGYMNEFFSLKESLKDINVLINAGPTREAIDPVRYISNHSTGKMGYAIAEEFACRGAMVTLVSGPVNLFAKNPRITVRNVTTANEMYSTTLECYKEGKDITILCAAVAD
ncbi:MAG: bifunctional phosphopantothenoylcysteine decarboxylase/phosphopantothenate--cysteine ligase CoaBC, partial [Bacteroidales bacterium]|nr:bifunctional phosphopantothenoylcysteine decarboxylase/phosphopantothenate--cysteine ligase CoaBC [Bacteroidales bacterium]